MEVINIKFVLSFYALPLRLPSYFQKVPDHEKYLFAAKRYS